MFLIFRISLASLLITCAFGLAISAQQAGPVVVQPGAPGQPTKVLPDTTRGKLPPISRKDVEFMQGMIHHHAQAVEMTALIEDRTTNKQIRLLGARISQAQQDEINFMMRWLEVRGGAAESGAAHAQHDAMKPHEGAPSHGQHGGGTKEQHLMPGMLTKAQMDALRHAKGVEFDRLFLSGMIQHHEGALTMVKDLFNSAGSGQDAELFNFATDVDSGQRAEIKSMQTLLEKIP